MRLKLFFSRRILFDELPRRRNLERRRFCRLYCLTLLGLGIFLRLSRPLIIIFLWHFFPFIFSFFVDISLHKIKNRENLEICQEFSLSKKLFYLNIPLLHRHDTKFLYLFAYKNIIILYLLILKFLS